MFYQRKYCNFDFILKILKFLLIFYKYFLNENELGRDKNFMSGEFYILSLYNSIYTKSTKIKKKSVTILKFFFVKKIFFCLNFFV